MIKTRGIWSLRTIMEVFARWFLEIDRAFRSVSERLAAIDRTNSDLLTASDLNWFSDALLGYLDLMNTPTRLWCPTTGAVLERLFDQALMEKTSEVRWTHGLTFGELRKTVQSAWICWEEELRSHVFFGELTYARFYRDPIGPWWQVAKFFECRDDIEEARKCIALGRFTASVFHMMRVVEAGVLALQIFLEGRPDPKAHIGSVISKLEDMTQKTKFDHLPPVMQAKLPFLIEVLPHLYAVKRAWRDKVVHADSKPFPKGTFTEEKAVEIHEASLALMKTLGEGLFSK